MLSGHIISFLLIAVLVGCGSSQSPEQKVIEFVKQDIINTAHDPSSIEFVEISSPEFTHINEGAKVYKFTVTYRGKNTYGATVLVKYLYAASESGQVAALTQLDI